MKRSHFKLILVACFLLPLTWSCSKDDEVVEPENGLKRYDVKSGIVRYDISISSDYDDGNEISGNGTAERFFTNWGMREYLEEVENRKYVVVVPGVGSSTSTETLRKIEMLDNFFSYSVDFDEQKIRKRKDALLVQLAEINSDLSYLGRELLKLAGGKQTGTEEFMGYQCEVWEFLGVTQWIYKGVPLKVSTHLIPGLLVEEVAVSISFDVSVPESNFELPDYPIEDTSN